jgi:hypothetical protein
MAVCCVQENETSMCKTQGRIGSDLRRSVVHGVIFPAVIF